MTAEWRSGSSTFGAYLAFFVTQAVMFSTDSSIFCDIV